jgi:hypothetical protein
MALEWAQVALENGLGWLGETAAVWAANILIAVVLILLGMMLGKLSKWILKKLAGLTRLHKLLGQAFLDTLLTIVKWIIYVVFLQAAIIELEIPTLSLWLQNGLLIIPTLVAVVLILVIGYSIAVYLKDSVRRVKGHQTHRLSDILYIFSLYVAVVLALVLFLTGVLHVVEEMIHSVILFVTLLWGAAVAWNYRGVIEQK